MSDNEKSAEKLDVLFGKVYLPVFMSKLAERGIEVKSEEDMHELLKIAALTRVHAEADVAEQGAECTPAIKAAAAQLEAMTLGEQSLSSQLLQDPEIADVFAS